MPPRHTPRLVLRKYSDSDVDALYEILGNRSHMQFTYRADSRHACEAWLKRYADFRTEIGFAPWTLAHRSDHCIVGWGGLNIDPVAPEWGPEITYFIHPRYQGIGLAGELATEALSYGFTEHGLSAIGAFTKPENVASSRVLIKSGFKRLRYESALERDHYEISRLEWGAVHPESAGAVPG
jgi:[ribosomal protein S5]-alanine N-acetyltransferase